MRLRRDNAHGEERDFFDDPNLIGFTRAGVPEVPGSGLAVLITDSQGGSKRMCVGPALAGRTFRCVLGGQRSVRVDEGGWGVFTTAPGRPAVYVPRLHPGEWLRRWAGCLNGRPRWSR